MPWLMLLVAGLFEVGWAIGLKYTEGFTRFWPSVGTLVATAWASSTRPDRASPVAPVPARMVSSTSSNVDPRS